MDCAVFYHKGMVRKNNEDSYYMPNADDNIKLYIVADGMGGHKGGEIASKLAVETVVKAMEKNHTGHTNSYIILRMIKRIIEKTNREIYSKSIQDVTLNNMGTTITMVYINDDKAYVGHVGDSSCYLIRDNKAHKITKDHSLVQQLVDQGKISIEEAKYHRNRNIITRAVGTDDKIKVDCSVYNLEENDRLLICSDGLSEYIDPTELDYSIYENSDEIVNTFGENALKSGGKDNITILLVDYDKEDSI